MAFAAFAHRAVPLVEAGIGSVVWCIGFRANFGWLDAPVFDAAARPAHQRGVTAQRGLYFVGLPWLHTWGSGRFSGVDRDAAYLVEHMVGQFGLAEPERQRRTA